MRFVPLRIVSKDMTISHHADCLIVGAGIAGLVAARTLQNRGLRVLVLDKGRGVGGRLATRNFEGGRFDYGAQFFTVRNPAFRGLVEEWMAAGVVAPWSEGFFLPDGRFKDTGEVHYRGVGGMRTIATHLALNLDVRSQVEVKAISVEKTVWNVTDTNGNVFAGKALILTPPVPQSLALLEVGNVPLEKSVRAELSRFAYNPCIAVMAVLESPSSDSRAGRHVVFRRTDCLARRQYPEGHLFGSEWGLQHHVARGRGIQSRPLDSCDAGSCLSSAKGISLAGGESEGVSNPPMEI